MAPTSENPPIRDGQMLTGPLFSKPMRVETVRANGSESWVAGMAGVLEEDARLPALFLWVLQSTEDVDRGGQSYYRVPKDGRQPFGRAQIGGWRLDSI